MSFVNLISSLLCLYPSTDKSIIQDVVKFRESPIASREPSNLLLIHSLVSLDIVVQAAMDLASILSTAKSESLYQVSSSNPKS